MKQSRRFRLKGERLLAWLEQIELCADAWPFGRAEARGVQPQRTILVQPKALACQGEAMGDQVGELPLSAHARAERRIVVAAAPHLLHEAHHVLGAQRIMLREPVAE